MNYIMISNVVLDSCKLNSTDKLLMGIINSLSSKDKYCYASNEYLANRLKVSKRTITNSLAKLSNENFIKMETISNGRKIYLTSLVWNNTSIGIE